MTRRDWRAGELGMLLAALVLAIAALTSVGFVADRMRGGLDRDARQMLGADLRVRSDYPLPPDLAADAAQRGLRTATTAIFPSMALGAAGASGARVASRLVAIKAVSPGYPLRGAVRIADAPAGAERDAAQIPAAGTVWVDANVLDALGLRVGETLRLGSASFRVAAVITRELDRGVSFVSFAPRVMLAASDLPATGLTGYGSRIVYRLLVAGQAERVAAFEAYARDIVKARKLRGVAFETLEEGQPQVRETLDRARHFLSLVALLTALLAAVAIALAAQRFMRRHLDGCAVMRCLGASERQLRAAFAGEFILLAIGGGVVGTVFGFVGHAVLLRWLGSLLPVALPAPGAWPALQGLATALVLLVGFALPPLLALTRVPPVHVLRRSGSSGGPRAWAGYAPGIVLFALLLIAAAGQWRLGGIVVACFAAGVTGFAIVVRLALWALGQLVRARPGAGARGPGWRYALTSLERRGMGATVQITALGIGLMCLLLLAVTQRDLIAGWQRSMPADAPNRFIIDIQPEQARTVAAALAAAGVPDVVLAPMVRGRLVAINGRDVDANAYAEDNARRLVEREFNLSYAATPPPDNRIVAGNWYSPQGSAISLEEGIARTLHLKIGDRLRFDVAGQQLEAPVTSLRKLDWGSFRVNFFVLMPPATLRDFPATFITSFHALDAQQAALDRLSASQPNLTVIDTGAIVDQLRRVLEQVIAAVRFLFAFTLVAGLLVLYAALAGTRDARVREAALLRALGASHAQVRRIQWSEFVTVGALAGILGAVGAQAIGSVLARHVFEFPISINLLLPVLGAAAGIGCAALGGFLALRRVLAMPVLASLREN
jgi:putative ABC transport system permease protein